MARYGPPDDFHDQPTEHANWGPGGPPQGGPPPAPPPQGEPGQFGQPVAPDLFELEDQPTPWYRRPVMLAGWILLVVILIGLIVFGIVELIHGNQGAGNAPSTSTTTTATTTSTTSTTTTTTTTTPTTTPTTTTSSSAAGPPPQPTYRPTWQPTRQPAQPPPHHHLPHLPSVITIPEIPTVITLPPGLP